MYTDTIEIIPITEDEWGKITESVVVTVKARVEDFNNLIKDINGNNIMPSMLVILPKTAVLKINYFIKIKTKNGIVYELPDKKWSIKKIYHAGAFKPHHIEVYL